MPRKRPPETPPESTTTPDSQESPQRDELPPDVSAIETSAQPSEDETEGAPSDGDMRSDVLVDESMQAEGSDVPPDPLATDEGVADRPGPARAAPRSVSEIHLRGILESLVFVSDKPLGVSELAKIARADAKDVRRLLSELREEYRTRGIHLDEIAGGWQFRSSAANAPFVRELLQARPVRLTRAQVETLAIIAYRQPITRPEVDDIRGVDSGSAIKVLLERELIRMLGRKEDVGRPVLYGTTGAFLEFFGLKSLRDLPTLREFTDLTPESEATLVRELGDTAEPSAEAPAADGDAATTVADDAVPPSVDPSRTAEMPDNADEPTSGDR